MLNFLKNLISIDINIEVFVSFILGFISTSFFYFYTERKNRKRELKLYLANLKKDSDSFIKKIQLIKRSVEMFHCSLEKLTNNEIGSIGFPDYEVKIFSTEYPLSVLDYNVDEFIEKIELTNSNILGLNSFFKGFYVDLNQIQNDLQSGRINKNQALSKYNHQKQYLEKYMSKIDILEQNAINIKILFKYFLDRTKHKNFRLTIYNLKMDILEKKFFVLLSKKEREKIQKEINETKNHIISEI